LLNIQQLRIKESKFPNMPEDARYIMSGITQECLDNGDADLPLAEIDLTRADVELVIDAKAMGINALKYLKETDWYASRLAETGKAIPEDILQKRQEARDSIVENN